LEGEIKDIMINLTYCLDVENSTCIQKFGGGILFESGHCDDPEVDG
jgi:hypothetical protein